MHAKTHKSGTSLPSRGAEEREADCSNRDHALLKKPSGTMDRHFRMACLFNRLILVRRKALTSSFL